jgi:tetratricopeptide (TPR) repeat protein
VVLRSGDFTMRTLERRIKLSLASCAFLMVVVWVAVPVVAMYIRPDIIKVPVDRLIKNLESQAVSKPDDASVLLNLARLHAMAYALKTDTAEVWKGKENAGAWFGYEPRHVPFDAQPSQNEAQLRVAREHLSKAIELYQRVVAMDPDNLTAALGYAWCLDQSGDKETAIQEYRKVIEAGWQKEKDMKTAPLGFHSVTAEAARYLIPLLDPDKDEAEIAALKKRMQQLSMVPRPITPIAIPLRNGIGLSGIQDEAASVAFDADGTGLRKKWTWITEDAGWLVWDPPKTGKVTSSLQMFGSVSFWLFWENGYRALSSLDDNHDGKLSGKELEGLAIWQDLNRNGLCEPGEVRTLREWGIVALSCEYVRGDEASGAAAYSPRGVVFGDGSTRASYDVILKPAVSRID